MRESIETSQIFRFGIFEVDARAHELRKQGVRIRLPEQAFQTLRYLLERAGDVVTRDELRQKLWPSSVYVDFDHGLNNAIARVREAIGESAGTPRFIETLPRLGYRFICPVESLPTAARTIVIAATVADDAPPVASIPPTHSVPRWNTRWRLVTAGIVAVLAALALLAGVWLARRLADETRTASLPKEPSIAVMPFIDMSGEPEKEHFGGGLSEELLDKLASIRGLKVVGRTSSSYYKDKQVPLPVIAEKLKVSHLLEGSVRRSGSRVRVTVQLIDAHDGYHRWSHTYDREFADIFQIQEEIARAVAAALQVQLLDSDEARLRSRGTRDADAYRLYLIAREVWSTPREKELLKQALARDPQFAAAHAGLADHYFRAAWMWLDEPDESIRLSRAAAERAVALDPELGEALVARANAESLQGRFRGDSKAYARALQDFRRAAELDPSNSRVFFSYARAVEWDEPQLAQSLYARSLELDPLGTGMHKPAFMLSRRGLHDAARERLQKLIAQDADPNKSNFKLAMGMLEKDWGRLDDAVNFLISWERDNEFFEPYFSKVVWSLYMSLGDRAAAREEVEHPGNEVEEALCEAAALNMDARFDEALESLDSHRQAFPLSRVLDLPTARQALITGHGERALPILKARLPDLARGVAPVTARNVIPALDLAAAYAGTGRQPAAKQLLGRIAAFLDGADAPRLPMFVYLRARTHALAGEPDLALRALERAYDNGFRMIWALDIEPQPLLYIDSIDVDPAFAGLRSDLRYKRWRERIRIDNARQLERVRAREATLPAA